LVADDEQLVVDLVSEARQLVHFITGCAGMFGESSLGDLALATEDHLDRSPARSPTPVAIVRRALETLIAALDAPRTGKVESSLQRCQA